MRRAVVAVATALLVVTAGCAGMAGTATPGAGGAGGDGAASGGGANTADSGTVNFYVSDQPNDMDDFAHLNVTITTVKFHLVDAAANGSAGEAGNASTATPTNATGTANATANATATVANGTVADDGTETEADDEDGAEAESEEMDDEREEDDEAGDGDGRWVTRDVNATSVDLSQLRGANATLLEQFDLPAGEYDKVHMEVSDIDATLTNGEEQRVKLPSQKLQLNSDFTVENGSEVDFVYDVTVHEAGNSGKYILKPVVSESGTEVPIERVDDERGDDEDRDDDERSIAASFAGNLTAGENVTLAVTENGSALANATVSVDGEPVGTTDADGELVVEVPSDAEELEVEVADGDAEAELEAEFESGGDDDRPGDGGPGEGAGNGQGD
ncbi:DUF4382 domain-containing protein [Halosimplex pelagicum]|uniref:DUF4382 domain-containing protein n=1 Tax=Halosimplex pelagicum TaxID=869886 RepID=A0A7D5T988_9EURY|nr:DUF4382 domain-containing protein [Halosimplex pelagicum]QLH80389.1 DUF4382 domain-containing protein [Halosimplex pelagicum]